MTTSATQNEHHLLNVYFDNRRVADIELSESIPDVVPQMFTDFQSMGTETAILTGDLQRHVNRIKATSRHSLDDFRYGLNRSCLRQTQTIGVAVN